MAKKTKETPQSEVKTAEEMNKIKTILGGSKIYINYDGYYRNTDKKTSMLDKNGFGGDNKTLNDLLNSLKNTNIDYTQDYHDKFVNEFQEYLIGKGKVSIKTLENTFTIVSNKNIIYKSGLPDKCEELIKKINKLCVTPKPKLISGYNLFCKKNARDTGDSNMMQLLAEEWGQMEQSEKDKYNLESKQINASLKDNFTGDFDEITKEFVENINKVIDDHKKKYKQMVLDTVVEEECD